jgi:D-alanyl-D-alanine endopeptidase (penicillin-binding protein 7)
MNQQVHETETTTPVVVTGIDVPQADVGAIDGTIKPGIKAPIKLPTGIPGLTASAYLVGDINTGQVYLEQNSNRVLPVASMSKLVTAFVATDMMDLGTVITISSSTLSAPPDYSNLRLDERFTLQEILQPLLLSSSNVAAEAIATTSDRAKFMEMMSSYAWEIGMPKSFFADPSGISPHNAASARDLFELAKYLVVHRPDILAVTRTPEASIATTTEHGGHMIVSTHPFVRDPRFIGGKTGRTPEAGETMMTILNMNESPIVFIILGSDYGARENDTRILLKEFEKKIATP